MPDNRISKKSAKRRYNLRSSKRAAVKNNSSGQPDADSKVLNTNKELNGHESTGEPSQVSGTPVVSQASGTDITSQASGTGMTLQAGDGVGITLRPEIRQGLIAGGMWNNEPTLDVLVTDEEMEEAGLGDLSAEFRAYAQGSWFTRAFVQAWYSVGWNREPRRH